MGKRYDVMCPRESNGKTRWTRVGVAFDARDGNGFDIILDVLPLQNSDDGVRLVVREPRDSVPRGGEDVGL